MARASDADTDYNIYYCAGDPALGRDTLERAQNDGIDAHSLAVDPRLADPEKIVDAIDKGVASGKAVIFPGEARLLYLWHALFPRLWWKTVLHYEK